MRLAETGAEAGGIHRQFVAHADKPHMGSTIGKPLAGWRNQL
jgi:hypothetical protein